MPRSTNSAVYIVAAIFIAILVIAVVTSLLKTRSQPQEPEGGELELIENPPDDGHVDQDVDTEIIGQ